ncbi:hypothetical protein B0H14DRAFT_2642448 [Mycena olivaceomarginata]|nr:hypothetical protein B0H14DRAFT_2642448 [Mycena olivaceomarginata]
MKERKSPITFPENEYYLLCTPRPYQRVPGAHQAGAVARVALDRGQGVRNREHKARFLLCPLPVPRGTHVVPLCHEIALLKDRSEVQRLLQPGKKRVCGALENRENDPDKTRHPEKVDRALKRGVQGLTWKAGVPQLYAAFGEEKLVANEKTGYGRRDAGSPSRSKVVRELNSDTGGNTYVDKLYAAVDDDFPEDCQGTCECPLISHIH